MQHQFRRLLCKTREDFQSPKSTWMRSSGQAQCMWSGRGCQTSGRFSKHWPALEWTWHLCSLCEWRNTGHLTLVSGTVQQLCVSEDSFRQWIFTKTACVQSWPSASLPVKYPAWKTSVTTLLDVHCSKVWPKAQVDGVGPPETCQIRCYEVVKGLRCLKCHPLHNASHGKILVGAIDCLIVDAGAMEVASSELIFPWIIHVELTPEKGMSKSEKCKVKMATWLQKLQCDLMARFFVQNWAIYNDEN